MTDIRLRSLGFINLRQFDMDNVNGSLQSSVNGSTPHTIWLPVWMSLRDSPAWMSLTDSSLYSMKQSILASLTRGIPNA